jgi:hypothetical protein
VLIGGRLLTELLPLKRLPEQTLRLLGIPEGEEIPVWLDPAEWP